MSEPISSQWKYFKFDLDDISGVGTFTLTEKKTSALQFLEDIHEKLKAGSQVQIGVNDKSLNDIVSDVVSGCEAKIGILARIWNCILRCFGIVPTIDEISSLGEKIQKAEMLNGSYFIFYFQESLKKALDFLPEAELESAFGAIFMEKYRECVNHSLVRIQDCVECGNKLVALFRDCKGKIENKFLASKSTPPVIAFPEAFLLLDRFFLIVAKSAFAVGNLKDACNAIFYMSKVENKDEQWVSQVTDRSIEQGHFQEAAWAVGGKENLRAVHNKIILARIQKDPLTSEDVKWALEKCKYVQDSEVLQRAIIDKCLEKDAFYDQLGDCKPETITTVTQKLIDENDLAKAKKLANKMFYKDDEVRENLVKAFLDKSDFENAVASVGLTFHTRATKLMKIIIERCVELNEYSRAAEIIVKIERRNWFEFRELAKVIFNERVQNNDQASAVSVAQLIIGEEGVKEKVLEIGNSALDKGNIDLAKRINEYLSDKNFNSRVRDFKAT